MLKKIKTYLIIAICILLSVCLLVGFTGCDSTSSATVSSIVPVETDSGTVVYVYYTDGTYQMFSVTSESEDTSLTFRDLYEAYLEANNLTEETYSYAQFLNSDYVKNMFSGNISTDNSATVAQNLLSVVEIYADTVLTYTSTSYSPFSGSSTTTTDYHSVAQGTGSIYKIDEGSGDDAYVYILTCYHVIYNNAGDCVAGGEYGNDDDGGIYIYLYGSDTTTTGYNGVSISGTTYPTLMEYSDDVIECEYVGGSYAEDVAVIRAKKSAVMAVNDAVKEITFADGYVVGETAITIGNYNGEGISVTEGNVAVHSEYIDVQVNSETSGNQTIYYIGEYRCIRLDLDSEGGNSGGPIFNAKGEFIGMLNAGRSSYESYTYAIPVDIVSNCIENILHYFNDGDDSTTGNMYIPTLGLTMTYENAKYVYDSETETGDFVEDVVVSAVNSGSIAESLGLQTGDLITALTIDDTTYEINNTYRIQDLRLIMFEGSVISATVTRDGVPGRTTGSYTIQSSDLSVLAISYKDLATSDTW